MGFLLFFSARTHTFFLLRAITALELAVYLNEKHRINRINICNAFWIVCMCLR